MKWFLRESLLLSGAYWQFLASMENALIHLKSHCLVSTCFHWENTHRDIPAWIQTHDFLRRCSVLRGKIQSLFQEILNGYRSSA